MEIRNQYSFNCGNDTNSHFCLIYEGGLKSSRNHARKPPLVQINTEIITNHSSLVNTCIICALGKNCREDTSL